jgi:hypothetical protein
LGLPLLPNVKLPKVIPYLIYVPTENDAYHLIVALKFIDPHFDPIALSKRIQQKLLDRSNGNTDKDMPFTKREIGMVHVPHLNDGFHNENRIFKLPGNTSLADNPQTYFEFLCNYFAISSQARRYLSDKEMARYRREAMTMASDPNFDAYCSISHPLNLNTLFSWERAMNFFSNISNTGNDIRVLANLSTMVKKITVQDLEDPLAISPARLNYTYNINLKPLLRQDSGDYRFRCYRYTAQQFRWCYYDKNKGAKYTAGLVMQMMPHVHPVFQLNDDTYTAIINKRNNRKDKQSTTQSLGESSSLIVRSRENLQLLSELINEEIGTDNMDIDREERNEESASSFSVGVSGPMGGIFNLFSIMKNNHNGEMDTSDDNSSLSATHSDNMSVYKAPVWTHLLDEEDVCLQSQIKAIPNSKLPAGYDSYLVYLVLIENRVTGPLIKINPTIKLGMRV